MSKSRKVWFSNKKRLSQKHHMYLLFNFKELKLILIFEKEFYLLHFSSWQTSIRCLKIFEMEDIANFWVSSRIIAPFIGMLFPLTDVNHFNTALLMFSKVSVFILCRWSLKGLRNLFSVFLVFFEVEKYW